MTLESIIDNLDWKTVLVTVTIGLLGSLYMLIYFLSHKPRAPHAEELQYMTINSSGEVVRGQLPSITSPTSDEDENGKDILLSVVVPSYNETERIFRMLNEAIKYLNESMSNRWEILIVDDGSKDGTTEYCLKLAEEDFKLTKGELRVLKLLENRGKGGAVREGMLHIRGRYGLFADADGASKFSDVEKLIASVKNMEKTKDQNAILPAIALGSRAHMVNTEAVIKRSFVRNCLMYGFHGLVYIFGIHSIKDTQCGFKLFNRKAIKDIFPYLHTEGWIFDVEILILAIRKNIRIFEIPISWHEVSGSKMDLAIDSIMMAKDLVVIRLAYFFGIYNDTKEV
ncbi:dolichyl-phosphate beta-glucosyltransferase NDAI_0F01420 [Naumovozyma dairenensis CBS 421]|uniref:dolichyl-phosphate beta-glucosyltransferase n=1 Tax=Naumovozyma dairenensis (strain ATCC 10597 / BCRC 20456 / CBS 421 / NBRC 0211 / NRRL Y-12639) TaxID=1071378 RepID=G0WCF0_NAUDC|nr:hypothetical protein NDAI_0F01420 [Naumovozyma dairenensis CBS 421]CCD25461.1 hypothetical protein NDAI_0F01420 [Naumovozyma dairenensis CBS 421]